MNITLTQDQLKVQYPIIFEVFFDKRHQDEGLHDYLKRKGINCFCKDCRKKEGRDGA